MVDDVYFFDSYAIVELIKENPNYLLYGESKIATTVLNVIEVHYALLREKGPEFAKAFFNSLMKWVIPFEYVITDANILKYSMRKQKLSSPDCIGYLLAKTHGIKFLTGDKEFENMPNVEFVK